MYLWNTEGVPHRGWTCVEMIDLGQHAEDIDFETRKAEIYEKCEMCQKEGIRYVHIMEPPEFEGQMRVGCICTKKMENDYDSPHKRENDLRNRYKRRMKFLKSNWVQRPNGNLVLK